MANSQYYRDRLATAGVTHWFMWYRWSNIDKAYTEITPHLDSMRNTYACQQLEKHDDPAEFVMEYPP